MTSTSGMQPVSAHLELPLEQHNQKQKRGSPSAPASLAACWTIKRAEEEEEQHISSSSPKLSILVHFGCSGKTDHLWRTQGEKEKDGADRARWRKRPMEIHLVAVP